MKIIAGPFIFSPNQFSALHHGLGGFLAWAEPGVAFYSWSQHHFFTIDIYSYEPFDANLVLEYVKKELKCSQLGWRKIEYDKWPFPSGS